MSKQIESYVNKIMAAVDDKKAVGTKAFFVGETSPLTDYILVVGALNEIHAKSLVAEISLVLNEIGENVDLYAEPKLSGNMRSGWLVMDLNSIVVHVILDELRQFYELDAHFEKVAMSIIH